MKEQVQPQDPPLRILIPIDLTLTQCDQLAESTREFALHHSDHSWKYRPTQNHAVDSSLRRQKGGQK